MSSENKGVAAYILERAALAIYQHCSNHNLNLVIVHACGKTMVDINNCVVQLKAVVSKFENSPKMNELLTTVLETACNTDQGLRSSLLRLSKTRWAARHLAYERLYFVYIVEALEVIALPVQHGVDLREKYPLIQDWSWEWKKEVFPLPEAIFSFPFIITFIVIYQYLSHLHEPTILLQTMTF